MSEEWLGKSQKFVQEIEVFKSENGNTKLIVDSMENSPWKWTRRNKEEVDPLSEWIKAVMSLTQIKICKLKKSMSTKATSPDVAETLFTVHNQYLPFHADKAPNNIVLVCKKH